MIVKDFDPVEIDKMRKQDERYSELKFENSKNAFNITNQDEAKLFIWMLDDAYLYSRMTEKNYLASVKDKG